MLDCFGNEWSDAGGWLVCFFEGNYGVGFVG